MITLENLVRARRDGYIFLRGFRGQWWIQESTITVDGMQDPVYRAGIYYRPEPEHGEYYSPQEGVVKYALTQEDALSALLPTINSSIKRRR